jgi:gas vesicle protein
MTNRDACIGFFAGVITGSAIAMLYAPNSGADTRKRIHETSREAGNKAKETIVDLKQGVERTVSEAASKVVGNAGRIVTAIEAGRDALRASPTQG